MDNFRFNNWNVYKEAKALFKKILTLYKTLPSEIKFSIGSQLIRSALSIILNIAEGSGKKSDKELNRFLDIALGSAYETLANLDVLKDNDYLNESDYKDYYSMIESITKQLGGFKNRLK